jgi:hypothetical protein
MSKSATADLDGAGPESITTIVDFENHWIHIAQREFRGYGFRARRFCAAPE